VQIGSNVDFYVVGVSEFLRTETCVASDLAAAAGDALLFSMSAAPGAGHTFAPMARVALDGILATTTTGGTGLPCVVTRTTTLTTTIVTGAAGAILSAESVALITTVYGSPFAFVAGLRTNACARKAVINATEVGLVSAERYFFATLEAGWFGFQLTKNSISVRIPVCEEKLATFVGLRACTLGGVEIPDGGADGGSYNTIIVLGRDCVRDLGSMVLNVAYVERRGRGDTKCFFRSGCERIAD
jgi:hypothetical protein